MRNYFIKFLLVGLFPLVAYGQTIVDTDPQNRKAVLEEFTGIYCVWCPDGHAIAAQMLAEHPGDAFAINIHEGGFAVPNSGDPDFRTPWGSAISNQTGMGMSNTGYPAGTINRQNFPGHEMAGHSGITLMDRGQWRWAANQVVADASYLNMAVEASIDIDTRELTVHVEGYYTDDSPESSNYLNVALLQNDTKGPQTGGGMGNNYNHVHRLVDLLTGQWGEEITNTTEGSLVDKTYVYSIPDAYNNVPAILTDMQLVVFMTESHQYIISGNETYPGLIGLEYQQDVEIKDIYEISPTCDLSVEPVIVFENKGEETITSLDIDYSINGGEVHTYTWEGSISSLHSAEVTLPEISYSQEEVNELNVTLHMDGDQNGDNNSMATSFDKVPIAETNLVTLTLHTDNQGSQTRWIIRDSNQQKVEQGNGYGNNQTYDIEVELPGDGCYSFRVIDTGNNGGASLELKDANGNVLIESDGDYGEGFVKEFSKGALGVNDLQMVNMDIYPNPSTGVFNIASDKKIDNLYVYDVSGKLLKRVNNVNAAKYSVDLGNMSKGVYLIQIESEMKVTTKKVIIK